MNIINYKDLSKQMLTQLEKGAFITVKNGEKINPMTIGWGSIGYIWNRPIFTALVRYSRYTYEMIEKTKEFTISVPLTEDFNDALRICGTESGRDIDKISKCNLKLRDSLHIETPVIDGHMLHFECKIVLRQSMEPSLFDNKLNTEKYPNKNYHCIYYGEILETYTTKK